MQAMRARLILVCHAATSATRSAAFPRDEAAEPQALAKASALAAKLGRIDAARTSPALRARQTAEALQLDATIEQSLRDIDLGRWTGRRLDEVGAAEPEAVAAWTTDPEAAPHGGEAVLDLLGRVASWLAENGREERRTVAVTHAAIIRAAIVLAIGAGPMSFWRIDIAPLSRVELRGQSGSWTLRSIRP
jgi:broad specificity phosphatase PhoE